MKAMIETEKLPIRRPALPAGVFLMPVSGTGSGAYCKTCVWNQYRRTGAAVCVFPRCPGAGLLCSREDGTDAVIRRTGGDRYQQKCKRNGAASGE